MKIIDISCLCGSVRVQLRGEPVAQFYCHCDDCQATSGGAYIGVAVYPADAVEVMQGKLSTWTLKTLPRQRCANCGTHVMAEVPGLAQVGIKANLLPPGSFKPDFHLHCRYAVLPVKEDARELRDRLQSQSTIVTRFLTLEQFLLKVMQTPDRHPVVDFALHKFERLPNSPVSAVTNQIGLSTRHFNTLFRDRVGLTPKLYCRIRRFQQVLRLTEGKKQIDWVDVAFSFGYFDQAHLIHDFRTFANCTPTEYVAKRGFLPFHVELSN